MYFHIHLCVLHLKKVWFRRFVFTLTPYSTSSFTWFGSNFRFSHSQVSTDITISRTTVLNHRIYIYIQIYIKVKVNWSRYRPGVAQRVGRGIRIALLFHDRCTRRGWAVSSTPRPHFTPGKDPVPILQEAGRTPGPVWMGGKSRPHRDSIPDRPACSQSLYRLSYCCSKMRSLSSRERQKFNTLSKVVAGWMGHTMWRPPPLFV